MDSCPKCNFTLDLKKQHTECLNCGLIFEKYRKRLRKSQKDTSVKSELEPSKKDENVSQEDNTITKEDTTILYKSEKKREEKNSSEHLLHQTNKKLAIIIIILTVTLIIPFLYFSIISYQNYYSKKTIQDANIYYLDAENTLIMLESYDPYSTNHFSSYYSNLVEKLNKGANVKRDLDSPRILADFDSTGDLTLNFEIPTKKSYVKNFVGLLTLIDKESNPVHKENYCFSLDGSVCNEKNLIPAKIEYSKAKQAFLSQVKILNFPVQYIDNLNYSFYLRPPIINKERVRYEFTERRNMALDRLIRAQNR